MKFLPENNRHYLAFVKAVYEQLPVPELFREKLGRVYEPVPEENSDAEPVELIPTVKEYLALKGIPVRELPSSVIFGIPMLSLAEVREGEAIHAQLASQGLLEEGGVWLLTPQEAVAYVAEKEETNNV